MQRRRGAELEHAIRTAVLDLIAQRGAAGVTMEAVATAAGTSKPVLYRRWPDSQTLVRDTLLQLATASIPHTDTGSYRGDMLAMLRGWVTLFTGPTAPILRAVIGAMSHDEVLMQAFRADVIGWRKEQMGQKLARGIDRGEVRADGDPIDDELAVRLVDDVLVPLVTPTTTGS
jgi:AcrR family transcriptional regulator